MLLERKGIQGTLFQRFYGIPRLRTSRLVFSTCFLCHVEKLPCRNRRTFEGGIGGTKSRREWIWRSFGQFWGGLGGFTGGLIESWRRTTKAVRRREEMGLRGIGGLEKVKEVTGYFVEVFL